MLKSLRPIAIFVAAAVLTIGLHAGNAKAQQTLRAAAVVNDEVISILDLAMRTRLTILSIGMQDTAQTRQRLAPQVLRALIDEKLQVQEAERLGIEVSEPQLQQALQQVAGQNNMTVPQLRQVIESNGIMFQALEDQVRARIAWESVIVSRIRPQVDISAEQVNSVVERLKQADGQTQWRVAEIFLAVDNPSREEEVRENAQRLADQLENGANFAALARQISQSASASVGGDLGWVQSGQMQEELVDALEGVQPGGFVGPIRGFNGYYILQVEDRRRIDTGQEKLQLSQLFLPVAADAGESEITEAKAKATNAVAGVDSCEDFTDTASLVGSASSGDLGQLNLQDLPADARQAVSDLPIEQPSEPVVVNDGVAVFMVCDRDMTGIDRQAVVNRLEAERLDMLTRRYLRDLRRQANVDIRVGGV